MPESLQLELHSINTTLTWKTEQNPRHMHKTQFFIINKQKAEINYVWKGPQANLWVQCTC